MTTNANPDPTAVSANVAPRHNQSAGAPDARPTIVNRASSASSLFGGWGPRLGH
jgi:hypothetical protein